MIRILIISAVFPVMVCSCCRQKLLDEYIINNNEVNNNEEIPYPEIQEPYVGAFWKANETGERLIRMNVEEDKSIESNGSWEVEISSGDSDGLNADEVMLAELPAGYSKYQGVKVNAGIAQISESEAKTSLSGTGDVAFRIGLKSALSSSDASPRYGLVTVKYEGKDYKIYLRQGEAPDVINGTASFAVYNIGCSNVSGSTTQFDFVEYPSMAGGFKIWNGLTDMYSPVGDISGEWPGNTDPDNIADICPTGFSIPNENEFQKLLDISSSSDIAPNINSSKISGGLYADGYFDRGSITAIVSSINSRNKSFSVGSGDNIAYCGFLVYNSENNASLFFPSAGRRSSNGTLENNGFIASYWSVTTGTTTNDPDTQRPYYLYGTKDSDSYIMNVCIKIEHNKADGMNIRAISDSD